MLKKSRLNKKVLTAMIMATLCSSSAYAMPTGGTVVSGNVTNVANPAELMTANANSIINWDSFSIAVGEKVSFDTRNFMVLNRVVGGQESQLLGMLSDQGNGKLILINPNGIVIGDNAIINVNDLTLSTLSLTNSNFQKLINGETVEFSEVKDGKISIGSNANLTLGEALRLYGGKITIADGVEIVSKENKSAYVQAFGANSVATEFSTDNSATIYGSGNDVEIGSATLGNMEHPLSSAEVRGDNVSFNTTDIIVNDDSTLGKNNKNDIFIAGSNIGLKDTMLINDSGDTYIVSRTDWKANYIDKKISTFELNADLDNNIYIDNSFIKGKKGETVIIGGDINLKESVIDSGDDLFIGAVKSYNSQDGVKSAKAYDDSTVNIDSRTTLNSVGLTTIFGSKLNINTRINGYVVSSNNPFNKYLNDNNISVDVILTEMKDILSDDEKNRIREILEGRIISSQLDIDALDKFNNYLLANNIVDEGLLYMSLDKSFRIELRDGFNQPALSPKEIKQKSDESVFLLNDICSIISDTTGNEFADAIKGVSGLKLSIDKYASIENPTSADNLDITYKVLDCISSVADMAEQLPNDTLQKLLNNSKFVVAMKGLAKTTGILSKTAFLSESIHNGNFNEAFDDIPEVFGEFTDMVTDIRYIQTGIEVPKALFSNIECGATLAKAGINGLCQLQKSIANYGSDGEYSSEDLASIRSEVSLSIIEAISNHGVGLGDMLYDAIRRKYGTENDGLSNAEQASKGYIYLANEVSKAMEEKEGNIFEKIDAGAGVGGKIIGNAFSSLGEIIGNAFSSLLKMKFMS